MTKKFDVDSDGYIKFTENELKELLDEVYKAGRSDERRFYWKSPTPDYSPNIVWCGDNANDKGLTISDLKNSTINAEDWLNHDFDAAEITSNKCEKITNSKF